MEQQKFMPRGKFFLAAPGGHGEAFCGPGMIRLLEEIAVTGNVRKACENIRVSYSKGWKLLQIIEECAGFPLVTKKHGGAGGGSAALTDEGMIFIEKYQQYVAECKKSMENIFAKIWGSLEG